FCLHEHAKRQVLWTPGWSPPHSIYWPCRGAGLGTAGVLLHRSLRTAGAAVVNRETHLTICSVLVILCLGSSWQVCLWGSWPLRLLESLGFFMSRARLYLCPRILGHNRPAAQGHG